jgi:hypothetical protein
VVGLFNWDYDEAAEVSVDLARCGLAPPRSYLLYDFWAQKFVGAFSGTYRVRLNPRGCQVLHVTPRPDVPTVIGSDRHMTGALSAAEVRWDPPSLRLTGRTPWSGAAEVRLFVYDPANRPPSDSPPNSGGLGEEATGSAAEMIEAHLLRLSVPVAEPAGTRWSVTLHPQWVVR